MSLIGLDHKIEKIEKDLKETRKKIKDITEKKDNSVEELVELGELLAKEKLLKTSLRDALYVKFFEKGGKQICLTYI